MAQHWIGLAQLLDAPRHSLHTHAYFARELSLFFPVVRDELVQGRIDQPDGDGAPIHGLEDADKIAPLERQQLRQGAPARYLGIREDHLLDGELAVQALLGLLEVLE